MPNHSLCQVCIEIERRRRLNSCLPIHLSWIGQGAAAGSLWRTCESIRKRTSQHSMCILVCTTESRVEKQQQKSTTIHVWSPSLSVYIKTKANEFNCTLLGFVLCTRRRCLCWMTLLPSTLVVGPIQMHNRRPRWRLRLHGLLCAYATCCTRHIHSPCCVWVCIYRNLFWIKVVVARRRTRSQVDGRCVEVQEFCNNLPASTIHHPSNDEEEG